MLPEWPDGGMAMDGALTFPFILRGDSSTNASFHVPEAMNESSTPAPPSTRSEV